MKRGFTLIELLVVIIIVGVLATIGFMQYGRIVEKARGAEAKGIIGTLRTQVAALRIERGSGQAVTAAELSIGGTGGIPGPAAGNCAGTHFFWYNINAGCTTSACTFTATRCAPGTGKAPQLPAGTTPGTIVLTWTDAGADNWTGTGGY